MDEREERIRARAHQLWLDEGCPDGRALEHWRQASEELASEELASEERAGQDGTSQVGAGEELEPAEDDGAVMPAAGPHAKPGLTNELATPGTGMLPEIGSDDPNQQPSG